MDLKTFLFNRFESRICRLNGIVHSSARPEKAELRQKFASHALYSDDQLPPKVDLRPNLTEVEDQSTIGSCVANSLAGAYEYLTKRVHQEDLDVSRLFIYYNARRKTNPDGALTDCGCAMSTAIESLEEFGVCPESLWPYDINQLNESPDQQAFAEAEQSKISEALQLDVDLTQMKSCLAQGFPFAFGLSLFTSFDLAAKSGVVPLPDQHETSREAHGSHAMLAVGYSDQSNSFIVRNSWGKLWGDQGYCYIPYSYMTNRRLCFDLWTVRQISTDDMGQEHWDQNDSVDYHPQGEENSSSQAAENGAQIEHYHHEEDLFKDLKNFAGNFLNSVFSLGL